MLFYFSVFVSLLLQFARSANHGDPIVVSAVTQHANSRTKWIDFTFGNMPKFGIDESVIYHATVPEIKVNRSTEILDLNSDFKISLAFDNHKHIIPWIKIYDSTNRRSLRRLIITFIHDNSEVISIDHSTDCKLFLCLSYFLFIS
jgi:hypothetical protein